MRLALKSIGTESKSILFLFLAEALLIGIIGATLWLLGGVGGGCVLGNLGPRNASLPRFRHGRGMDNFCCSICCGRSIPYLEALTNFAYRSIETTIADKKNQ